MHFKNTDYGFEYGALEVERLARNEKKGWESLSDEERAQQRKIWRDKKKKQQEVSRILALAMGLSAGAR